MSWGAVAGAAVSVVGGSLMADGAEGAAGAQTGASAAQIGEVRRQYDAYQRAVTPYTKTGTDALAQQRILLGLGSGYGYGGNGLPEVESFIRQAAGRGYDGGYRSGDADRAGIMEGAISNYRSGAYGTDEEALKLFGYTADPNALTPEAEQKAAIAAMESSPYFQAMSKQSEDAILQNASATGGLRGGNTQDALSKNRPILLQNLIDKQLANLQGLSGQGLGAATNLGNAGMGAAGQVGAAMQQQGAAQAGGILGQSNAMTGMLGQVGGIFAGSGGFGGLGGGRPPVTDGGYSMGMGSAYGGSRAGL